MPKVTLAKAVRYPLGSSNVHRSGTILDVTEAEEKRLRELGVLAEAAAAPAKVEDKKPKPEPVAAAPAAASGYPPLPKKTEPVAAWKEYARTNNIKLTGLTKRNEIIGYLTKVVAA